MCLIVAKISISLGMFEVGASMEQMYLVYKKNKFRHKKFGAKI